MPENSVSANVRIVNAHGMHLRPADLFARTAMRFQAKVTVSFEGQQVDGRSIVELLMLAAKQGSKLTIAAEGDDAQAALAALVELVEQGFGEMSENSEGQA
jgi:phosphocarrier protein